MKTFCIEVILVALATMLTSIEACSWTCPSYYVPVCASNGRTYPNGCRLPRDSLCNLQVDVVHQGHCDKSCRLNCDEGDKLTPVCGTDGLFYQSECKLKEKALCNNDDTIADPDAGFSINEYESMRCIKKDDVTSGTCATILGSTWPPIEGPWAEFTSNQIGKECIFPFTYFGVTYNGCVEDSSHPAGLHWCSTKVDSDGNHVLRQNEFGYCAANCPKHTGRRFGKLPPRPT